MKISFLRLILKIASRNIRRHVEGDTWLAFWPYDKSFIDQACSSGWLDIGHVLFLHFYGPGLHLGP